MINDLISWTSWMNPKEIWTSWHPGFVVSTLLPDKWQGVHVVDDVSLTLVPGPNITSCSLYQQNCTKANKTVSPDALAHLQWWPPAMVQLFSSSSWTCPLQTVSAKAKMSTWTAAENKEKKSEAIFTLCSQCIMKHHENNDWLYGLCVVGLCKDVASENKFSHLHF